LCRASTLLSFGCLRQRPPPPRWKCAGTSPRPPQRGKNAIAYATLISPRKSRADFGARQASGPAGWAPRRLPPPVPGRAGCRPSTPRLADARAARFCPVHVGGWPLATLLVFGGDFLGRHILKFSHRAGPPKLGNFSRHRPILWRTPLDRLPPPDAFPAFPGSPVDARGRSRRPPFPRSDPAQVFGLSSRPNPPGKSRRPAVARAPAPPRMVGVGAPSQGCGPVVRSPRSCPARLGPDLGAVPKQSLQRRCRSRSCLHRRPWLRIWARITARPLIWRPGWRRHNFRWWRPATVLPDGSPNRSFWAAARARRHAPCPSGGPPRRTMTTSVSEFCAAIFARRAPLSASKSVPPR